MIHERAVNMGDNIQTVDPIRDKKQLENMKRYLKAQNTRDWLLFVLGINSGLRISDLLTLTVKDVKDASRIKIREKKTDKVKSFPLSDTCKKAIKEYLTTTRLNEGWLFPSRKGDKSISRIQAYRILNDAAQAVGISENIGTHTLRKTFGYWAYRQGVDIAMIMQLLNHSAPSITKRYIGITQDELDEIYINLNL